MEFNYKGAKGNANNFLTLEDCQLVCQGWNSCSKFTIYLNFEVAVKNPCPIGTPLLDKTGAESFICGGEEQCPNGYWWVVFNF